MCDVFFLKSRSMFVTPVLDSWQTARFSLFARQSRVEINTQRDLEEMLSKLETHTEKTNEDEGNENSKRRKRKFLELAVPSVVMAVLCLVYCLVYMATSGQNMGTGVEMEQHLSSLTRMLSTTDAILAEVDARAAVLAAHKDTSELESIYEYTTHKINEILPIKTLVEWELINRVQDHRKFGLVARAELDYILEDSEFYVDFINDVQESLYHQALEFSVIKNWKTYYSFRETGDLYVRVRIIRNAVNFVRIHGDNSNTDSADQADIYIKLYSFVLKIGRIITQVLRKSDVDKESVTSATFLDTLQSIFVMNLNMTTNSSHIYPSNMSKRNNTDANVTVSDFIAILRKEEVKLRGEQITFLKSLKAANSRFLHKSVLVFCIVFLSVCFIASSIVLFCFILRDESRLSVSVTDWLGYVTNQLGDQKSNTSCMMKQLVPTILLTSVEAVTTIDTTALPYTTSEATFFLCSIAQFSRFFSLFTAAQTLHILTLVMELLDERMEQYNVLPVTRMGHNQIVISDTVQRSQSLHAIEISNLALDIMSCCSDLEIGRQAMSKLQMKIGIHTGPCIGVMRVRNGTLQFHITGPSVRILQKVHKTAIPNRIQVSDATNRILSSTNTYCLQLVGNINVKGLSKYKVYWLNGRRVSSATMDQDSTCCSTIGSWIELERKPLYRLDEDEGVYEPIYKARRYSQMSLDSYNPIPESTVDQPIPESTVDQPSSR